VTDKAAASKAVVIISPEIVKSRRAHPGSC
jgi:hypothetical protein